MSSRHRALLSSRLQSAGSLRSATAGQGESEDTVNDSESEEPVALRESSQLNFLRKICSDSDSESMSSSSSNESDEGKVRTGEKIVHEQKVVRRQKTVPWMTPEERHVSDLAYLDEQIAETTLLKAQVSSSEDAKVLMKSDALSVDPNNLNIDAVFRRRFGSAQREQEAKQTRNRKDHALRTNGPRANVYRRSMFCFVQNDWPSKPPSYIAGGLRMVLDSSCGRSTTYKFEWSPEYVELQKKFEGVKNSEDANMLVVFLSQNQYHHEALLQLALIFAKCGYMDRATDLIKRCLYYFDCIRIDSFKPHLGTCRMDPTVPENESYFLALFRYMQVSSMLGIPTVAANISKIILSLDREGDSYFTLLRIDSQLLTSGQYSILKELWDEPLSVGKKESPSGNNEENPSVRSLPGWRFSIALCKYFQNGGDRHNCEALTELVSALEMWPCFLDDIHRRADIEKSREWKSVLNHDVFAKTRQNLDRLLQHLSEIYAVSSCSLWKREELSDFLLLAAKTVIEKFEKNSTFATTILAEREILYTKLCSTAVYCNYLNSSLEDFLPEYIRFPPELQPIDENFMDPAILAAGAQERFRFPNIFGNNNRRVALREVIQQVENMLTDFGLDIDNIPRAHFAALAEEIMRLREERQFANVQIDLFDIARRLGLDLGPNARALGSNWPTRRLDPNLPLLQLLWQTLLPWNEI